MTEVISSEDPENNRHPSPSEIVSRFLDANDLLTQAGETAYSFPSTDSIRSLVSKNEAAHISFGEMLTGRLFAEHDSESVEMALFAIVQAVTKLSDTASALRPDDPTIITFGDRFIDDCTSDILGEDEDAGAEAMNKVAGVYSFASGNLLDKVMTSQPVVEFGLDEAKKDERIHKLVNLGTMAAATFVGTSLALYLDRRSRKNHP